MRKMTEENLKNAFAGESQAHIKYLAFADKAHQENWPNAARLFRANSYAEQVHAGRARHLGHVHRAELAGPDQADADRAAFGRALLQLTMKAHGDVSG